VVAAAAGLSFPVALVAGQVRAHVITTWSVTDLLREVSSGVVTPERLETLLREALGDPTLTVLSWDDARQDFVGTDGGAVPSAGPHRVIDPLVVQGRLVGAVVHDTTIDDAAGLADAIAAASYASLSHRSLQEQLHESRRMAEKAIEERATLERDLHDGAVQRALALQIGLADLLRRSLHPALRGDVEQLARQAKALGNDLRKLAHGLYPATLVERGLRDALVEATVGTGDRVRIGGEVGSLPPFVAHALYFSCLEAVQNVLRHAGSWTVADVQLMRSDGTVECLIADDGVGLDPANVVGGLGLKSIRDRIGAVGGSFELDSSFGNGTRVRLRVPLPAE
jgi:signal transduction histidine kinase